MSIKKNWRTTLLVLLITFTFTSVIGGTMAWFTDTVESSSNVIQAGTLDVELHFADAKAYNGADTVWTDVEADGVGPIFSNVDSDDNAILWEPGYTSLKYVQVVNNGNLAFKYQIQVVPSITPVEGKDNLADVIDVYYTVVEDGYTQPADFAALTADSSWKKLGTITDLMNQSEKTVNGVMLGGQAPMTIAIALHMQEEAGNEYQGLNVGGGFSIKLVATQYTKESDSFNDQYDAGAGFVTTDEPKAAVSVYVPENIAIDYSYDDSSVEGPQYLDTAYLFKATETEEEALAGKYGTWHADFVASVNCDIPAESIALAGQYEGWDWLGFVNHVGINAGQEVRLLYDSKGIYIPYSGVCAFQNFYCGAVELNDALPADTTLTVELRLYETYPYDEYDSANVETGNYITVGTFQYTFE